MMLATATYRRSTRRAAFTLLEVLVVVAILVILATVASIAVMRNLDDAKKSKAQLQAAAIEKACQAYFLNPGSGNTYPTALTDLVSPPWGGSSFLNDGQNDLIDPWGQQFQYQVSASSDNSSQGKPMIFTRSPDSQQIPISNYGIGQASRVQ